MLAETRPLAPRDIAAIPDDRILAAMTRRIFCAGFSSKVIDAKWEAFESAFEQFDPAHCAWMTEERFDELLKDEAEPNRFAARASAKSALVANVERSQLQGQLCCR